MPDQIFIIGPPRSGTSIMMRLCRYLFPDLKSYDEGHLIDLVSFLNHTVDGFFDEIKLAYFKQENMTVSQSSRDALKKVIANSVFDYHSSILGEKFIDKTHSAPMIYAAPYLMRKFNHGKAIILMRRPIEYMRSAMVKFHSGSFDNDFATNLNRWVNCMNAWITLREQLTEFCLPIEHYDIAFNKEKVGRLLTRHFNLTQERKEEIKLFLEKHEIEKTEGGSYEAISLEKWDIDDTYKDLLVSRTADLCKNLGYSYDEWYFANCKPSQT